ncbi:unnamed protein product, partial [Ixodes hexagonus]
QSSGSLTLTALESNGDAKPAKLAADGPGLAPAHPGSGGATRERSPSVTSRGNWGNRWEFLLSCVGLSVGIGNVWRFPYLAYKNGGGAFLIPYLIMLALAGKPMYFLELAFGQFAGQGPLTIWACAPICKGVGFAMVCVSMVVAVYYNVIMAYTLYYTASTFQAQVPWQRCDPAWANGTNCFVRSENIWSLDAGRVATRSAILASRIKSFISPSELVRDESGGIENTANAWDHECSCTTFLANLTKVLAMKVFKIIVFSFFFGTLAYFYFVASSAGHLAVPWCCHLATLRSSANRKRWLPVWTSSRPDLLVRAGSHRSRLADERGSSFDPIQPGSVAPSLGLTFAIFDHVFNSLLGVSIHYYNFKSMHVFCPAAGPGLAFVAYPEALTRLPVPQLWSVLFFLMLFILGLDSEFAILETFVTSLCDQIPFLRAHKWGFTIVMGIICFLLGLPMVTRGGQYVLELVDNFGGSTTLIFIGLIEIISLAYVYGYGNFSDDVFFMLDKRLGWYWRITWTVTSPLVLFIIFIFAMLDQREPLKYGKYVYPGWAVGVGWAITLFVMLQIPFWAIVSIYKAPGDTFFQKLRQASRPSPAWGPSDVSLKDQWKVATGQRAPGIKVELKKFTPSEATNDLGGVENKAYTVSEQDAH